MNGWVRGTYDDTGETTEEVFALLVCPDKIAYIVDCSVVLCACEMADGTHRKSGPVPWCWTWLYAQGEN